MTHCLPPSCPSSPQATHALLTAAEQLAAAARQANSEPSSEQQAALRAAQAAEAAALEAAAAWEAEATVLQSELAELQARRGSAFGLYADWTGSFRC